MTMENAFRLSRIQAEGWKAARCIPATQLVEFDDKQIETLNPYSKNSERVRWSAGFNGAIESLQV